MAAESPQPSLLRNASQTLANSLLNQSSTPQSPGQGYAPPEDSQPTVRRTSTTVQTDRERFNEQQQRLAVQMCIQAVPILCCIWWLALAFIGVTFYVYLSGVAIWYADRGEPCDQPLVTWVSIMLLIPPVRLVIFHIRACASVGVGQALALLNNMFSILGYPVLLCLGVYWLRNSHTCEKTNPDLYSFTKIFLLYHVFQFVVVLLVLCGFARLIFFLHNSGLLDGAQQPAREGLVNELEQVPFDPSLFSEKPEDDKPSPECCICQTLYADSQDVIVRTKCNHYFHKECLGGWLKKARTCPLCRFDLETGQREGPEGDRPAEP